MTTSMELFSRCSCTNLTISASWVVVMKDEWS